MIDLEKKDKVNHPLHYQMNGIEVIDIIKSTLNTKGIRDYCRGNAIKYILRAGKKTESNYTPFQKEIEDLEKAIWYLDYEIEELKKLQKNNT